MSHFDDIYEIAADNYGIVTRRQAASVGVARPELTRFVAQGRLVRLAYGVYKLTRYIPTPFDRYAEGVALVGEGSFLYGESVLAMHELALVNPMRVTIATCSRTRKNLPGWLRLVKPRVGTKPTTYEGIPSQTVFEALETCSASVMPERLTQAVGDAHNRGLLTDDQANELRERLSHV